MSEQSEIDFVELVCKGMTDNDIQPITSVDLGRMIEIRNTIQQAELRVFCDFKEALARVMAKRENIKTMEALAKV